MDYGAIVATQYVEAIRFIMGLLQGAYKVGDRVNQPIGSSHKCLQVLFPFPKTNVLISDPVSNNDTSIRYLVK